MLRFLLSMVLSLLVGLASLPACSICGGNVTARLTMREQLARAEFVAIGKLKNPQFNPQGGAGRTEFHIEQMLKASRKLPNQGLLLVPRYIPVIGNTPPDYLLCCLADDGKPEPIFGKTVSAGLTEHVQSLLKLDERDPVKRLSYAFSKLDSTNEAVAADAFLEFAKAPDAEIFKAKGVLQPAKLRQLLSNPKTPTERLGVFALLLGFCGSATDANFLAEKLQAKPLDEGVRSNLGGYLAGLILMNGPVGWKQVDQVLTTEVNSLNQRLSAIGAVRFLHATRPQEERAAILACYAKVLATPDLADLAIDDLRLWKWWDLSESVFKLFDQPLYQSNLIRRGIVRYGLQCPENSAKRFIAATREKDLKLVQDVEELLKAFEPIKP